MIKSKISLLAIALAAISSQAMAATATGTFQATATLNSACVVSASNVNFGAITPAATGDATATGTITSTCSKNVPYSLAISSGSGTFASRTMAGAASGNTDKLNYNLYTEEAATMVWGDGSASTVKINATGTGIAQQNTVFGKLSLNQRSPALELRG